MWGFLKEAAGVQVDSDGKTALSGVWRKKRNDRFIFIMREGEHIMDEGAGSSQSRLNGVLNPGSGWSIDIYYTSASLLSLLSTSV